MGSPDKKNSLLSQMNSQNEISRSLINFQIEADAHPDDKNLLVVLLSLQYLLSNFPGGDTENGSEEYQYTALQVNFHNTSNILNPHQMILFDHEVLGPKVQTLWEDIRTGRVVVSFQDPSADDETAERQHWGVAVAQNDRLPIARIHLPNTVYIDYEADPLSFTAYIAGASHVVHEIEEHKAGRGVQELNVIDQMNDMTSELAESLKLNLTAIFALVDSMGSRKVGVLAFYKFLKKLESFKWNQN